MTVRASRCGRFSLILAAALVVLGTWSPSWAESSPSKSPDSSCLRSIEANLGAALGQLQFKINDAASGKKERYELVTQAGSGSVEAVKRYISMVDQSTFLPCLKQQALAVEGILTVTKDPIKILDNLKKIVNSEFITVDFSDPKQPKVRFNGPAEKKPGETSIPPPAVQPGVAAQPSSVFEIQTILLAIGVLLFGGTLGFSVLILLRVSREVDALAETLGKLEETNAKLVQAVSNVANNHRDTMDFLQRRPAEREAYPARTHAPILRSPPRVPTPDELVKEMLAEYNSVIFGSESLREFEQKWRPRLLMLRDGTTGHGSPVELVSARPIEQTDFWAIQLGQRNAEFALVPGRKFYAEITAYMADEQRRLRALSPLFSVEKGAGYSELLEPARIVIDGSASHPRIVRIGRLRI